MSEKISYRWAWKEVLVLFILSVIIVLFWDTRPLYPLKLLVVFFHELSHGFAAMLTGGEIVDIELNSSLGGRCVTRGGNRFVVLTAGYLGSLLWGGLILLMSARTRWDSSLVATLGLLLVLVTVWLIRPWFGFGFWFCGGVGVTLLALAAWTPAVVSRLLLRVVGLTSVIYAPLDIKSDVLDRPELRSDAAMLAEITGLPTIFWGIVWCLVALLAAVWFIGQSCRVQERADAEGV